MDRALSYSNLEDERYYIIDQIIIATGYTKTGKLMKY